MASGGVGKNSVLLKWQVTGSLTMLQVVYREHKLDLGSFVVVIVSFFVRTG